MVSRESTLVRRVVNIEIVCNIHSSIIIIGAIVVDRKGGSEEGRKRNIFLLG